MHWRGIIIAKYVVNAAPLHRCNRRRRLVVRLADKGLEVAIFSRLIAIYLVVVAVVVAINFIATPLYHPGGDEPFTVWEILNWFMAVALVITVASNYLAIRQIDADSTSVTKYWSANLLYYASAILFLTFFYNWFSNLSPNTEPDGLVRVFVDTLMPIVVGVTGCHWWQFASK